MEFTQEKRLEVLEALKKKHADRECERCGNRGFSILEGYFKFGYEMNLKNTSLGGPNIPTFAILCDHCGNMSFFAAKMLLPNDF